MRESEAKSIRANFERRFLSFPLSLSLSLSFNVTDSPIIRVTYETKDKRAINKDEGERGTGRFAGWVFFGLTFADVPLLYEAPQHVGAAMAVRRLVKRLLAEAVPVASWSLSRDRRHVPRSAAAPLTPDFHREATQGAPRVDDNIITRQPLCDLETVRVHNCVAAAAPAAGCSGPSWRTVVLVVA